MEGALLLYVLFLNNNLCLVMEFFKCQPVLSSDLFVFIAYEKVLRGLYFW